MTVFRIETFGISASRAFVTLERVAEGGSHARALIEGVVLGSRDPSVVEQVRRGAHGPVVGQPHLTSEVDILLLADIEDDVGTRGPQGHGGQIHLTGGGPPRESAPHARRPEADRLPWAGG